MTILLAEEVKQVVSEGLPVWIEEQPDLRLRLRQAIGKIPGEPLSKQHQLIVGFLEKVLETFVEQHNLGVVLSAPFQMRLEHGREPDLLFVANEHLDRLQETCLDGPADLVVEIVSPESAGRDRGEKFYEYARGGVPEYWLIDPLRQWAEFYHLGEDRRYRAAFARAMRGSINHAPCPASGCALSGCGKSRCQRRWICCAN